MKKILTGVLLLSRDNFYADVNGSVSFGPKSDKIWLKKYIKNKVVFVGYNTWETIKNNEQLISSAASWVIGVPNDSCEVHFGGPKSFMKYKPDRMIIHKTRTYLKEGLKFECPCNWTIDRVLELPDYTEIVQTRITNG